MFNRKIIRTTKRLRLSRGGGFAYRPQLLTSSFGCGRLQFTGVPYWIHFVPNRDDSSAPVAALERSDNVVARSATLSLRFGRRQGYGGLIAGATTPLGAASCGVGENAG
jgi:hypothetical protein